jgi:para-nitrobenzyl esterase
LPHQEVIMSSRSKLLGLASVCAASVLVATDAVNGQGVSCLVATSQGDVQGVDAGASCAFLGVPYAAPPVNDRRWRPPQAAPAWGPGVLPATTAPPSCPLINPATNLPQPASNENCLYLNVWTPDPKPSIPAPVIVWLHGGNFVTASANFGGQNGRNLAEQTGVIVVAPNYRLGPFGFLAHAALTAEDAASPSSGNYGLLDQRAALAWVRDHIAAFGGDPEKVTVGGNSSGAHSAGLHLVSPDSRGLFDRAILQGGFPVKKLQSRTESEVQGDRFADALGCTDPSTILSCMRGASRDAVLLALTLGTFEFKERPTHWTPNVDGVVIPDQPRVLFEAGAFARVPLLLGVTRDEGWTWVTRSFSAAFTAADYAAALDTEFGDDASAVLAHYPLTGAASPRDVLSQLTGDAEFTCEASRLARLVERTGTSVYLFSFEYEVDAIALDRVVHGLETNFVFGNTFGPPLIGSPLALTEQDKALARKIGGYWSRFAATGNPNSDDLSVVHWPAFKHPTGEGRGADKYLILADTIREEQRLREAACAFWSPYFFRSLTGPVPGAAPA